MSLDEPIIVEVTTVEETTLVVDVVTPPVVPAVDVTVINPGAIVIVDVAGEAAGLVVIDVVTPPPLFAIDVTVGDPAATIVVDIPGDDVDEVIGGIITIGSAPPSSPNVNDIWIDTT